jgi:uncharacterized protein YndB with AHSA1/START domain
MAVISTHSDAENLTLTIIAEFDTTPEHVWELWEDPRKLERWWGPPTFPATFTRHDFFVGGESRYFMTGPEGETPRGWWRIDAIDRARRLDFASGLAGNDGEPVPDIEPTSAHMILQALDSGTRMTVVTRFVDVEQMEMLLGMEEGMAQAIGQIDSLLSSSRSRA